MQTTPALSNPTPPTPAHLQKMKNSAISKLESAVIHVIHSNGEYVKDRIYRETLEAKCKASQAERLELVNALQSAESLLTVDFATPNTVEGRRALSFVNSLRTLLTSLS